MSPTPIGAPPVAPSIAAQQVPLAQYAAQAAGGGSPQGMGMGGDDQKATSLGLAQSLLTKVGNDLTSVAKIVTVEMPEAMPILKTAVGALVMLLNEVTKQISPDNGAATQNQPMPASGAVSASS